MGGKNSADGMMVDESQREAEERETTFEDLDFRSRGHEPFIFDKDQDDDD